MVGALRARVLGTSKSEWRMNVIAPTFHTCESNRVGWYPMGPKDEWKFVTHLHAVRGRLTACAFVR